MDNLLSGSFTGLVEASGKTIEAAGIAVIVGGAFIATLVFLVRIRRSEALDASYRSYREDLGRSILLGLEFLVAADIIRTVAVEPTFRSVGVLATIVVVRTFLSVTLEVETTGRWPWKSSPEAHMPGAIPVKH